MTDVTAVVATRDRRERLLRAHPGTGLLTAQVRVGAEERRDPAQRPGIPAAARHLGWVLRHRRRLPAAVEADRCLLDGWDRSGPERCARRCRRVVEPFPSPVRTTVRA